jgi:pyruvate dehydrogenase E2 component (dihydrolipoamide acetyltransferase)
MSEFVMPSLGADMEAGTLLEWFVKPGDAVKRGDIVAVVDTSKAEIEIEIFEDGVIDELLVATGERVPVGTPLARIRTGDSNGAPPEPPADQAVRASPAPAVAAAAAPAAPVPKEAALTAPPAASAPRARTAEEHRPRVSPLARRIAEENHVDLTALTGTGPGAAITRADVEAVLSPETASPPPGSTTPQPPRAASAEPAEPPDRQAAMRAAIAALMARSKREIPHYYLQTEIDLTRALDWLHEENLSRPMTERLLSSVLLLSAVAHAVVEMPELNGFWIGGAFRPADGVHLGVAISLRGGGLIAPALHHADRKTLDELMAGVRDLVGRARTGRLRGTEMSDPTITVTNLGERGVDLVHGVIYPPQVALVGFGGVRERPWAIDGMLGVRPTVIATLAADHRASDGHTGSRLLTLIDHRLQEPEQL